MVDFSEEEKNLEHEGEQKAEDEIKQRFEGNKQGQQGQNEGQQPQQE